MQPRSVCWLPGQGSEVTPTSVLTPPSPSFSPPPPHEAAITTNTATSARNPRPLGTMVSPPAPWEVRPNPTLAPIVVLTGCVPEHDVGRGCQYENGQVRK